MPGVHTAGRPAGAAMTGAARVGGCALIAVGSVLIAGGARTSASAPQEVGPVRLAAMSQPAPVNDARVRQLAEATNRFGFALQGKLAAAQPGRNLLVSPYSLAMALAVSA